MCLCVIEVGQNFEREKGAPNGRDVLALWCRKPRLTISLAQAVGCFLLRNADEHRLCPWKVVGENCDKPSSSCSRALLATISHSPFAFLGTGPLELSGPSHLVAHRTMQIVNTPQKAVPNNNNSAPYSTACGSCGCTGEKGS